MQRANKHSKDQCQPSTVCQAKGFGPAPTATKAAPAPTKACPCGSGAAYATCCKPYHEAEVPLTPEALMRSRFSGYAKGNIAYIIATTHPENPLAKGLLPDGSPSETTLFEDVRATMDKIAWEKLKVLSCEEGSSEDEAYVTFQAWFKVRKQKGQRQAGNWNTQTFVERARFLKQGARWLYVDGDQEWKTASEII